MKKSVFILALVIFFCSCSTLQIDEMSIKQIEITLHWWAGYKTVFGEKTVITLTYPENKEKIRDILEKLKQSKVNNDYYKGAIIEGRYTIKILYHNNNVDELIITDPHQIYNFKKNINYDNPVILDMLRSYIFIELENMIKKGKIIAGQAG